jgi:hypothetical protein
MVAFATTAPVGSVTDPEIDPVVVICADTSRAQNREEMTTLMSNRNLLFILFSLELTLQAPFLIT